MVSQARPWIGLNPVSSSTWTSGLSLSYTNWASGEPNGGGGFCGHMNRDFNIGKWNDVPCSDTWSVICEKRQHVMHNKVYYIIRKQMRKTSSTTCVSSRVNPNKMR